MLETLLESEAKRKKSLAGALVSVTAHTAVIAAALYATAQARPEPARAPEVFRPVYFPAPQHAAPSVQHVAAMQRAVSIRPLAFVAPRIDLHVPAVDISGLVTEPGDFLPGPISHTGLDPADRPGGGSSGPFLAHQVERQAALAPGNAPPRYPEALRSSGVEGRVIAQFIVDEQGRAEPASLKFLHSDNQLFQEAVRAALGRMRFVPAQVGGKSVRQLVQMPFVFTLAR